MLQRRASAGARATEAGRPGVAVDVQVPKVQVDGYNLKRIFFQNRFRSIDGLIFLTNSPVVREACEISYLAFAKQFCAQPSRSARRPPEELLIAMLAYRCLHGATEGGVISGGERVFIISESPADATVHVRTDDGRTATMARQELAAESARATVLGDFVAEADGELTVYKGDEVVLLDQSEPIPDGWILAVAGDIVGFMPDSYVEALRDEAASPPAAIAVEAELPTSVALPDRPTSPAHPAPTAEATPPVPAEEGTMEVLVGLGEFDPEGEEELHVHTESKSRPAQPSARVVPPCIVSSLSSSLSLFPW